MFQIADLWQPILNITRSTRIVTFGSCFAQHIGRALRERGYSWLNCEPAPPGLSEENARAFGYNIFSARTGNIYTSSMLKQWAEWAAGIAIPPDEVWEKDGRFVDPFRPRIEPEGFVSIDEMMSSRAIAVDRLRRCIEQADIFVFTLGLTESWFNRRDGYEYPLCPGTAGGTFNEAEHAFVNQDYGKVRASLIEAFSIMRAINPNIRFVLTVSPVPLMATNAGRHVLVSTMASKAVLRAVADSMSRMTISTARLAFQRPRVPVRWKEDWIVSGQHEISPHGVSITAPGANPFCGIKRRKALQLVEGDEVIVRIVAEGCSSIIVHVAPSSKTKRGSVKATRAVVNGLAEVRLPMERSGRAVIWVAATDASEPIFIKDIVVESRSGSAGLVDYFPSYEIINSPAFGGVFFEPDKRGVSRYGVDFVMDHFFTALKDVKTILRPKKQDEFDVICDELVLDSFAKAAE